MDAGKKILILLFLCMIIVMTACENAGTVKSKAQKQSTGVADVLKQGMAEYENGAEAETDILDPEAVSSADNEKDEAITNPEVISPADYEIEDERANMFASAAEGIDLDLTALSANMVYSEVFYMMVTPENYIGKTIKMAGPFVDFYDETMDKRYFACIIRDATACCAQGMEFILTDDYTYPDDYPEDGSEI